jgi:hypothetical protein
VIFLCDNWEIEGEKPYVTSEHDARPAISGIFSNYLANNDSVILVYLLRFFMGVYGFIGAYLSLILYHLYYT